MMFGRFATGVTLITGTDTDVGKTVATAWLAAGLRRTGVDVALCKPAQTGISGPEGGDVAEAAFLAGVPVEDAHEFVRLPEPLAPTTAGRRAGIELPTVAEYATRIARLVARHDAVLVEGAGGILVGLDAAGSGLLELADELRMREVVPRFVVVTRAGLGTLNHTALTVRAIRDRGHEVAGLVIGAMPAHPGLAETSNITDLPAYTGAEILACLPAGIGSDPVRLQELAGPQERADHSPIGGQL